jgi:hypothetical protein
MKKLFASTGILLRRSLLLLLVLLFFSGDETSSSISFPNPAARSAEGRPSDDVVDLCGCFEEDDDTLPKVSEAASGKL